MDSEMHLQESRHHKKKGCESWKVWVLCSLLIAAGLGVGLGVGLSNKDDCNEVIPPDSDETTTKPPEATTTKPSGEGPWTDFRLPPHVVPEHYDLTLQPNTDTDDYTGINKMDIEVTQETNYILFHVDANLEITKTSVNLVTLEDEDEVVENVEYQREFRYGEYEYWVIESASPLKVTNTDDAVFYRVTVEFKGSLVGKIVGLYKSEYLDPDTNEMKAIVGSDMEPTDARKAYPCFDEPALKISYTTTLIHQDKYHALSNMDIKSTTNRGDGWVETVFNKSPKMPTYLGCFAVSEFGHLELRSARNNIPLRVYLPKHQIAAGQANYSLEVLKKAFDYYETRFVLDFSLPKMDMIAIPNFGTGAMENWGLITYRETNLLYDEQDSSESGKQRVAQVVAHELVHQWFGDLVTMRWWDNIWLNEGFASFFEYEGQDYNEPTWDIPNHFVIDDEQRVLRIDSSVTTHPIVQPVSSPSQITSLFDTISYSKGACVLRVMQDVLGDDLFIGGLVHYLEKRQYGNADHLEMFSDVQEYIDMQTNPMDIDVTAAFLPWVEQLGYPVIHVESSGSTFTAKQQHFLTDPDADLAQLPPTEWNYKWRVDLSFATSDDPTPYHQTLLLDDTDGVEIPATVAAGGWIKLNVGQKGYYRVNYEDSMWATIAAQLESNMTVFSEVDRSNLLDDAFNLAPAELITYAQALDMTTYLDTERSYYVWDSFSSGSSYIRIMLENSGNTEVYDMFKTYYQSKVQPAADELGWDTTQGSHNDKLNRYTVLALALRYGYQDALDHATAEFEKWIADENYFLPPDTRSLIYRYGIAGSGESEWQVMLDRYIREQSASEKSNLLRGLTSTENVDLIDKMLENCKDESIIKSQDFFTALAYLSYTQVGNRMTWQWTQLNWQYMIDRFDLTDRNFGGLIPDIAADWNTELQLWELTSFFERYPEAGAGESGRASTINSINENIAWVKNNIDIIATWLSSHVTP